MKKNVKQKRKSSKRKRSKISKTTIIDHIQNLNLNELFYGKGISKNNKDELPQLIENLIVIFSEYNPLDTFLALNISELWLPNISSQVKHTLALNVLLSMKVELFRSDKKINTYQEFRNFLTSVYQHLPESPHLEDYVPEQDWGEIKILWKNEIYRIFYGGSVELITDYIKAFEIYYSSYPNILKQMENILILQNICFSFFDKKISNVKNNIEPGYIEIPSEEFWHECYHMLVSLFTSFRNIAHQIDEVLIKKFGDIDRIDSSETLSNMILEGVAIPAVGINIDNNIYPVSFRNMVNVVIEYYAKKNIKINSSYALSDFLSQRFNNIIKEPFKLCNKCKILPYEFFWLLQNENKFSFFTLIDINQPNYLRKLCNDMYDFLLEGEWFLTKRSNPNFIQIKNNYGKQATIDNIEIIVIFPHVSTGPTCNFELPKLKCDYFILSLVEFIFLFDSVKNLKELSSFRSYLNKYGKKINALDSIVDIFASFKTSNSVLEDGAVSFNMISLDPHWGSNWRFNELKEYWLAAPSNFPSSNTEWNIEQSYDGNVLLIAQNHFGVSWSTEINNCTIHFYSNCEPLLIEDPLNGKLLTLFLECICDALSQRKNILKDMSFLKYKNLTIHCLADQKYLVNSNDDIKESNEQELVTEYSLINKEAISAKLEISINLQLLQYKLNKTKDASFQAELCITFFKLISIILSFEFPSEIEQKIQQTKHRKPRIITSNEERKFDTSEESPNIPEQKHFKLARKKLAQLIKDNNIQEGKYELHEAKDIINSLATSFRNKIHATITSFNRNELLLYIIENYDAYVNENYIKEKRIKLSLQHEVNYNRVEELSKLKMEFNRTAANYRYLLECTVNLNSKSTYIPATDEILQLIADVDWLIVLYSSSDIIHNDIDVGGLIVDNFYIPQVYFSANREINEKIFNEEQARYKLGYNLNSSDEIGSNILNSRLERLDTAFKQDLDFNYSNLLVTFSILFQWAQINQIPMNLSYTSTKAELEKVLIKNCKNLSIDEARKIINFLILEPDQIRKLLGSESEYFDVPISDHNKRSHRYNIRPLIEIDNKIIWGAAATYRSYMIWTSHLANGHLPAEFEWKHVSHEVRNIKEYIENQLETKTFEIIKRFTSFSEKGIDFKRRFKKEKFPDVGDFDTLAYFPEKNIWLNIECKYNQPYYCLKDMRRLREKIFGKGDKRGQIGKIEKRITFLTDNQDKILSLLNWNNPEVKCEPRIINLYISRQIYWWLRYPPYAVDINFVQVDFLDFWLQEKFSTICSSI